MAEDYEAAAAEFTQVRPSHEMPVARLRCDQSINGEEER
jgi:hypothetical protein